MVGLGGSWKCSLIIAAMVGPGGAHFREYDQESDAWAEHAARGPLRRCGITWSDITGIM